MNERVMTALAEARMVALADGQRLTDAVAGCISTEAAKSDALRNRTLSLVRIVMGLLSGQVSGGNLKDIKSDIRELHREVSETDQVDERTRSIVRTALDWCVDRLERFSTFSLMAE